ncbi:MAG: hypothetical protein AB7H71_14970 [Alphaproteobacteria bacterium]
MPTGKPVSVTVFGIHIRFESIPGERGGVVLRYPSRMSSRKSPQSCATLRLHIEKGGEAASSKQFPEPSLFAEKDSLFPAAQFPVRDAAISRFSAETPRIQPDSGAPEEKFPC